jgi:hypothetical protein
MQTSIVLFNRGVQVTRYDSDSDDEDFIVVSDENSSRNGSYPGTKSSASALQCSMAGRTMPNLLVVIFGVTSDNAERARYLFDGCRNYLVSVDDTNLKMHRAMIEHLLGLPAMIEPTMMGEEAISNIKYKGLCLVAASENGMPMRDFFKASFLVKWERMLQRYPHGAELLRVLRSPFATSMHNKCSVSFASIEEFDKWHSTPKSGEVATAWFGSQSHLVDAKQDPVSGNRVPFMRAQLYDRTVDFHDHADFHSWYSRHAHQGWALISGSTIPTLDEIAINGRLYNPNQTFSIGDDNLHLARRSCTCDGCRTPIFDRAVGYGLYDLCTPCAKRYGWQEPQLPRFIIAMGVAQDHVESIRQIPAEDGDVWYYIDLKGQTSPHTDATMISHLLGLQHDAARSTTGLRYREILLVTIPQHDGDTSVAKRASYYLANMLYHNYPGLFAGGRVAMVNVDGNCKNIYMQISCYALYRRLALLELSPESNESWYLEQVVEFNRAGYLDCVFPGNIPLPEQVPEQVKQKTLVEAPDMPVAESVSAPMETSIDTSSPEASAELAAVETKTDMCLYAQLRTLCLAFITDEKRLLTAKVGAGADEIGARNLLNVGHSALETFQNLIFELLNSGNAAFIDTCDLAVYLAKDLHMRLIPNYILVEISVHPGRVKFNSTNPRVFKDTVLATVLDADGIVTQCEYYKLNNGSSSMKGFPNCLRNTQRQWFETPSSVHLTSEQAKWARLAHVNPQHLSSLANSNTAPDHTLEWHRLRSQGCSWETIQDSYADMMTNVPHRTLLHNICSFAREVPSIERVERYLSAMVAGVVGDNVPAYRYAEIHAAVSKMPVSPNVCENKKKGLPASHRDMILAYLQLSVNMAIPKSRIGSSAIVLSDNSIGANIGQLSAAHICNLAAVSTAKRFDKATIIAYSDSNAWHIDDNNDAVLQAAKRIAEMMQQTSERKAVGSFFGGEYEADDCKVDTIIIYSHSSCLSELIPLVDEYRRGTNPNVIVYLFHVSSSAEESRVESLHVEHRLLAVTGLPMDNHLVPLEELSCYWNCL